VESSGMGNALSFDAERLRILIERHHRYTGSARAKMILDDWDASLRHFVKIMPKDYRMALAAEHKAAAAIAAE
jgi:glutamate synthase (NADPH/NADH) large chain